MNKKLISQGNDLLESSYNLSIDEFRLLNIALAKIDSKQPKPHQDYVYSVTSGEFKEYFGIDTASASTKLKQAANALMSNPIVIYSQHKTRKDVTVTSKYHWLSYISYDSTTESTLKLKFSEYVAPYLYELARDFTQVKFQYVAKLDTPFSIRLYSWLCKARKLNKCKDDNGMVRVTLNVEWMKERAGLIGKYDEVKDFKKRVIDPAIRRINTHTDMTASYESIKKGKQIIALEFAYIEEALDKKEIVNRPRLPRRPHITKGSHDEGVWARECIKILLAYENELHIVKAEKLPRDDAKRLNKYYELIGDNFAASEVRKKYNL